MSIITFWNSGKEQTGKTLSLVAICTHLAIEHNYRILVISTGYQDEELDNCFWKQKKIKQNLGLFGPNTSIDMDEGIAGLYKIMRSNKLSPDQITNYSKIILKDRLEVLSTYKGNINSYNEISRYFPDMVNLANNYYDLVLVDLDKRLPEDITDNIMRSSNLIIASLSQRLASINRFMEIREKKAILKSKRTLILIGRYDKASKYSIKNISRYMKEKNKVSTIPYNTLFFEACEEAKVVELFLKLRRTEVDDSNEFFLSEVKRTIDNIIYRLQSS